MTMSSPNGVHRPGCDPGAEGEGYDSVAGWRAGHEDYWHGTDHRDWLGNPDFTVDDDTPVVLERFRLVVL